MIDDMAVVLTARGALNAIDDVPETQFLWENEDHSAADPNLLQVEEVVTTLGENHVGSQVDRLVLNIRYNVLVPRGSGTTDARRVATKIKQLFKIGSSIVGAATIVVDGSEVLGGRARDEARWSTPVSIIVRAEALRD